MTSLELLVGIDVVSSGNITLAIVLLLTFTPCPIIKHATKTRRMYTI